MNGFSSGTSIFNRLKKKQLQRHSCHNELTLKDGLLAAGKDIINTVGLAKAIINVILKYHNLHETFVSN